MIEAWDTRACKPCGTTRVHYRAKGSWHCIGMLPGRRHVKPCEGAKS